MDYYVGKILDGRYEIQEVLGVGGMAIVYRAYDNIDDRPVAVKILKEEYLANEEFRRRFKNESKAIAMLSHPNIVKVYDVSYGDRLQYIVMEYVEGITLKEYIEQRRVIPWKEAVHFLTQILRALQHAHDRGVVHRDIKPQNIMLLQSGNIKVTDFGIARFSRSETRTMSENAIGSVHYISPEQARGDFTDEKADIYSVGVVLYEMLTGELPFQSDSTVSVAIMQLQSEPRRPREINDAIPLGLEQITIRAMQKSPAERYQSAAEMLLDLEEFKRNPLIRFEYSYFVDREPTKYVSPLDRQRQRPPAQPAPVPARVSQRGKQLPAYEAEEEEEERSKVVPIMTGIIFGLVALFAVIGILVWLGSGSGEGIVVEKFTGMKQIDIENNMEKYNDKYEFVFKTEINNAKDPGVIFKQEPDVGAKRKPKENGKVEVTLFVSASATTPVPDVVGLPFADAEAKLRNAGFEPIRFNEYNTEIAEGKVIRSDPAAKRQLESGKPVRIYVALKEDPNAVEVPDVKGWSLEDAKSMLEQVGLVLDESNVQKVNSLQAEGKVVYQSVDPTKSVSLGTKISVHVSNGIPPEQSVSVNIQLPNRDGAEGSLKVYVNNEKIDEKAVLLTGVSSYPVSVKGQGADQKVQITLDEKTVYTATVDFTKDPPVISNEQVITEKFPVPNVLGKEEDEALEILSEAGFDNVTVVPGDPGFFSDYRGTSGVVYDQKPSGSQTPETQITLYVSR
ncbi:MAG: Stk1 family PASTA domain-containing Ser/Thr kinase [Oscillospiraceae bacterium]|nr:Stk1 family PASTA domain-containing Ser/Thr kinase [Oscillospiraceae bacterium]